MALTGLQTHRPSLVFHWLVSCSWVCQVVGTPGYGRFGSRTQTRRVVSWCWRSERGLRPVLVHGDVLSRTQTGSKVSCSSSRPICSSLPRNRTVLPWRLRRRSGAGCRGKRSVVAIDGFLSGMHEFTELSGSQLYGLFSSVPGPLGRSGFHGANVQRDGLRPDTTQQFVVCHRLCLSTGRFWEVMWR